MRTLSTPLCEPIPATSKRWQLNVIPVPPSLSLGDDRVFVVVVDQGRSWSFPFQFYQDEALNLLRELQGLDWRLDENGIPVRLSALRESVEDMMSGAGRLEWF